MPFLVIRHWKKREWTGWEEDLVSDIVVRPLVPKRRDDRHMIVLPPCNRDAGRFAGRRVTAVDGGKERGADLAAVLQRNDHSMRSAFHGLGDRPPQKPQILSSFRPGQEGRPQVPVLMHDAERLVVVGFEREPARLKTVGNLDLANGAALSRQLSRDPDRFQHAHGRGGDGARAAVKCCAFPLAWIGRIDDDC